MSKRDDNLKTLGFGGDSGSSASRVKNQASDPDRGEKLQALGYSSGGHFANEAPIGSDMRIKSAIAKVRAGLLELETIFKV